MRNVVAYRVNGRKIETLGSYVVAAFAPQQLSFSKLLIYWCARQDSNFGAATPPQPDKRCPRPRTELSAHLRQLRGTLDDQPARAGQRGGKLTARDQDHKTLPWTALREMVCRLCDLLSVDWVERPVEILPGLRGVLF